MRKITILVMLALTTCIAMAQYKPAGKASTLLFKIKNLGFDVNGSFTGLTGSINFDEQWPARASFDVTIDANTVNTGNALRDSHLRDNSYFDVKKYPAIHFVSSRVSAAGKGGAYTVTARLTIKDVTRDISFPFTATPLNGGFIFKGSFKINRRDFGVGGASTISNELQVFLDVIAVKA